MSAENVLYWGSNGLAEGLVIDGIEIPNIDADSGITVQFAGHSLPRVTVTLIAPNLTVIADHLGGAEASQSDARVPGGTG